MKVSSSVTHAMSAEEKEEFIKRCQASKDVIDRFKIAVEKRLAAYKAESTRPDKYEKAAWPYYQADSIGYMRALDEIIKILNIKE